jgi:CheY-like chemotaxis protein
MKPHLFLLDYHLPDINGLALYDRLHALPTIESTPAILFSAGSVPENEVQKRHLLFIQKPFDLDELIGTVERTLN